MENDTTKQNEMQHIDAPEQSIWDKFFDPTLANKLDDMAIRVLHIEIENPAINQDEIAQMIGVHRSTIWERRKTLVYKKMLAQARRTAFQKFCDLQDEAIKKMKVHLNGTSKRLSFEASKFILGQMSTMAVEKAKAETALEMQDRARKVVTKHEVRVIFPDSMPILVDSGQVSDVSEGVIEQNQIEEDKSAPFGGGFAGNNE